MKLNSIWTYVIVFVVVFAATAYYKVVLSNNDIEVEDFEAFYEKFLNDSTFQLERINFPLEGLPAQADSIDFADGYHWTKEQWEIHKNVDVEKLGYERELMETDYLVKEVLYHPQGWGLERRFMVNEGGEWYLVYYAAPNAVKRNNLRAG